MFASTARLRRTRAAVIAGAIGVSLLAASPANTAEGYSDPHPESLISGPSRPAVAAWGLAYNPVTGEMVVGDYVSNQIRRYALDGTHLGDFSNPKGHTEGVASAVAVDPRNGWTYLGVTGDGRTSQDVRKYDRDGNFVCQFNLPGSVTWLTVDSDGDLWVPRAWGGARVAKYSVSSDCSDVDELRTIGSSGTGPGQFKRLTGIGIDETRDYVFVSDPGNKIVHQYRMDGAHVRDFGAEVINGDIRGITVDEATGRVFFANSNLGTIEVYDVTNGAHLDTWGGLGSAPGQFADGARQLARTPDGTIWAADYAGRRVQAFNGASGAYVSHFPSPAMEADPASLVGPRGVATDPTDGTILVADPWGQRVQRFAPDGTVLKTHGKRGTFVPEGMNYPRSIAVDPDNGNVWVGNYEGMPKLVIFDKDFAKLSGPRRIFTPRFVNDIEFANGEAYVLIRRPGVIHVHDTATGELKRVVDPGQGYLRGIAIDEATGHIWVTSDRRAEAYILDSDGDHRRTLALSKKGWGVSIHGDHVYVADANANKIFVFGRTSYDQLGTFGSPGFGPGQMRGPSGIDHDTSGRLYVVEERNGRVQSFSHNPLPAAESTAPTVTWTGPRTTSAAQLVATGTVSDASGVIQVEVVVKDKSTGLSYNARTGVWGSWAWNQAVLTRSGTTGDFHFTLVPTLRDRDYLVVMRATDVHGNVTKIARTVTVS